MAFLAVFAGILFAAEWFLFRIDIQKDGQSKAESIRKTIIYQIKYNHINHKETFVSALLKWESIPGKIMEMVLMT